MFIESSSFISLTSFYFNILTEAVNIWGLRINFQKTFPETLIFIPKNVNIYSTFFWQLQRTRTKIISIIQLEEPLSTFSRKSDSRIANVCLSVRPSVIKTPQPLRIMPISQISAYLSLLAIMKISHNATQPTCPPSAS